jgi:hypothetical protein
MTYSLVETVANNQASFNKLFTLPKAELLDLLKVWFKDHKRFHPTLSAVLDDCIVYKTTSDDMPVVIVLEGRCPETHPDEIQIRISVLSIYYRSDLGSNFKIMDFNPDLIG